MVQFLGNSSARKKFDPAKSGPRSGSGADLSQNHNPSKLGAHWGIRKATLPAPGSTRGLSVLCLDKGRPNKMQNPKKEKRKKKKVFGIRLDPLKELRIKLFLDYGTHLQPRSRNKSCLKMLLIITCTSNAALFESILYFATQFAYLEGRSRQI